MCVCTFNGSDVFTHAKSAAATFLGLPGKVIDFAVVLDEKWPKSLRDIQAKCVALPSSENGVAGVGVGFNKRNLEQAAALSLLLAVEVERRVLPGVKQLLTVRELEYWSKELPAYVDAAEHRYRILPGRPIPIGLRPGHDRPAHSALEWAMTSQPTTPADEGNEAVAELRWLLKKAEGERDSLKAQTDSLKAENAELEHRTTEELCALRLSAAESNMRELGLRKALLAESTAESKALSAVSMEEHAHAQLQAELAEFRDREQENSEAQRILSLEFTVEVARRTACQDHLRSIALNSEMQWSRYREWEMCELHMFNQSVPQPNDVL